MCDGGSREGNGMESMEEGACRIKLCGLSRERDIAWANELMPDYVGFVFAKGSRRYVAPDQAAGLRRQLKTGIVPVGVFVDEPLEKVLGIWERGIIDVVQLHGTEGTDYIRRLREQMEKAEGGSLQMRADASVWQAFRVRERGDIERANASEADLVLLDSGSGSGAIFDWSLLSDLRRPCFLAGGLTPENVGEAIGRLHPFGVDASSALETNGYKDWERMAVFVRAVREERIER